MKLITLCFLLVLFFPIASVADNSVSYQVLDSEFKGGIIVFKVEVYENSLAGRLPSESELLWVADQLIGDKSNDSRRKLVQFFLPGMTLGAYATANRKSGPIEVSRNPTLLFEDPKYGKYINENYEFIE